MESQPQNPEFRINSENFHPCIQILVDKTNLNRKITTFNFILSSEKFYAINTCIALLLKLVC